MCKFRLLNADEIECRIGTVKQNGISLLLYKDARCDMSILDETFGCFGWQRMHEFKDGKLYCTVSVYDKENGMWIDKEDVGTESNTEAEKGQASDSFKRACVNWGIGRELYTAPFIWISGSLDELKRTKFSVQSISYDDKRRIASLVIVDDNGVTRFSYPKGKTAPAAPKSTPKTKQKRTPLDDVIRMVYDCKTLDELNNTYLMYPEYKNDDKLIAACKAAKALLEK